MAAWRSARTGIDMSETEDFQGLRVIAVEDDSSRTSMSPFST
jgi:hypothetical protein